MCQVFRTLTLTMQREYFSYKTTKESSKICPFKFKGAPQLSRLDPDTYFFVQCRKRAEIGQRPA